MWGGLRVRACMPACSPAGLFVAAGHEGSGLCMGPATARLLLHHMDARQGCCSEGQPLGFAPGVVAELMPDLRLSK